MRNFGGLVAFVLLLPVAMAWGQEETELAPIEVIGTTPFQGSQIPIDEYPGAAQTADGEDIERSAVLNFNSFLNQEFGSVHVNDAVNNPFKPDLHYRGYTASPLLGLPQGLSIYQDGVRVNEPFGDAVNFDFIPLAAIASVDLVPGSNPIFGLNTLGGALNIKTKDGFSHPGLEVRAFGGDFGRYGGHIAYGGNQDDLGWFVLGQMVKEDGWRDFSKSEVYQFFGKVTKLTDHGEINLSMTAADNTLRGNGAVPVGLVEREGRDAIFTYPDETKPDLLFFNLRGVRHFTSDVALAWGAYYRSSDTTTFNGDGTEYEQCDPPDDRFLCDEDGEIVQTVNGQNINFIAPMDGTQNTSDLEQDGYGLSLQLSTPGLFGGTLITGATVDYASSSYRAGQEVARLTDERGTIGYGLFPAEPVTRATTRHSTIGVFALHRMPLFTPTVEWTLGGRYNYTNIEINDRNPRFAFLGPDTTSLNGESQYKRLNLFTGLTWDVTDTLTLFGNAGQSSRAPTPLELSCANPDAPCRFPNGLVDDPPLEAVVATTFAVGARGA
ncbi:MAG: TonB-dependent receptor, partial [Salinisphaera sp.]|nr:TonB-dependent receptor [Salinisphaera sp.]